MIDKLQKILSTSIEEVVASSLVLDLIDLYSKLYLNGSNPGGCEKCLRTAYNELMKTGMEKIKQLEEIKSRTCKPAWNGLKYINATARHWNSDLITDNEAIKLLEAGHLKKVDFEILPFDFEKPIPDEKVIQDFEKRHLPKKAKQVKKGA